MDLNQIKELITFLEESKLSKLVVKKGDVEICLEKEPSYVPLPAPIPHPIVPAPQIESAFHSEKGASHKEEQTGPCVTSPMVGTFYTSPAPDKPSFIKVGDRVEANTVVCIIEAMKVLNEVKAGVTGIIIEVLADNGQPVEFGTRLFRVSEK